MEEERPEEKKEEKPVPEDELYGPWKLLVKALLIIAASVIALSALFGGLAYLLKTFFKS